MKKYAVLLLAVLLLLPMLPAAANAQEPPTLTIMRLEHASFTYSMDQPVIKALEERLGVKIVLQVYSSADYKTKLNMLLATNDLPDIVLGDYKDLVPYVSDDMFVNLSDNWDKLPNYAATIEKYADLSTAFKVDGDFYWFIMTAEDAEAYGNMPMVRQDVLEAIGWDHMPDSFEELYEMLGAIKEWDPNCVPFVTRGTDVLWRMGYAYGTYNDIYFEPDDQQYEYGPLYDRYRSFLGYINRLYTEGLLDPDFASSNKSTWMEYLTGGKSYFLFENGSFATDINMVTTAADPNAKFVPMKTLANYFGGRRNQFFEGCGYICPFRFDVWVINSESKNVEAALALMDYIYGEEGALLCSYGVEGEHYTVDADGNIQLDMDQINYYLQNANDPYREYKNSLGTGALAFAGRFYETRKYFLDDDSNAMYAFWLADESINPYTYTLCLSAEASAAIIDIKAACDTMVAAESLKFIMGTRPLEEYDNFVADLLAMGAQEIERVYNEAYEAAME